MSLDDLLNKKITIKEGIDSGIISIRIMQEFDIWERVQSEMRESQIPKTHAIERVAETCKINESTVWRAVSFTSKILKVT